MSDQQNKANSVSWKELLKGLIALLFLVAIGIGMIAGAAIFAGPGIVSFLSSFSTLDTGVIVALIAGSVSIITFVGGSILNNRMKRNEYL